MLDDKFIGSISTSKEYKMSYGTSDDIEYRRKEKEFVGLVSSRARDLIPDGKSSYYCGFITMGLTGVISGIHPLNTMRPVNLPLDPLREKLVRMMWRHVIQESKKFCEGSDNNVQLKDVLLQVHNELFVPIENGVRTAREREAPNRT